MIKKQLYRIEQPNGVVTITPKRPDESGYEIAGYRLIADEGKIITDGVESFECKDVESPEGYYEIDIPQDESEVIFENN